MNIRDKKSNLIKLAYLNLILIGALSPSVSFANGEVKIFGLLREQPCAVMTENVEVNFGSVTNKDLFKNNHELRDFQIELANCGSATLKSIAVKFNGNASENNTLLNLNASSAASGFGVKILNDYGEVMTFGETQKVQAFEQGRNVLNFTGMLQLSKDTTSVHDIAVGAFTATATFEVEYQ